MAVRPWDAGGEVWGEVAGEMAGPMAVVVGSEGRGLRRLVKERCDFLLQLPMLGQINSLNASIAGSVVLYEVLRQRRARGTG